MSKLARCGGRFQLIVERNLRIELRSGRLVERHPGRVCYEVEIAGDSGEPVGVT